MKKSHNIVDRLLKKVWSDIDIKLTEGIYTEEFLKSFYYHLIDEVGEKNADILMQEFQREKETEEEDSADEKEIDKFGMLTQIEKDELKKKEKESENIENSKSDIGWGHQIRSYVLHPYKMVKDNRTNFESTSPDKVLDGDIDEFLEQSLYKLNEK